MITRIGHALSVPARFPNHYCWYVLVCALDLILTNAVMTYFGAVEVNAVAHHAIERAGFRGLIALKVSTMIVVIGVIELLARRAFRVGHRLAEWSIAISGMPVVVTLLQLAAFR